MRQATQIVLTNEEKNRLQWFIESNAVSVKLGQRAEIILLADQGLSNVEIAQKLNITRQKVARWRVRFVELGIDGIEKDASRPGRKEKLDEKVIEKILEITLKHQPVEGKYWTQKSVAEICDISSSSVGRIWKKYNITPR